MLGPKGTRQDILNDDMEKLLAKQRELLQRNLLTCETCDHWRCAGTTGAMPLCSELRFWIAVDKPIHTSSNFGCNKHSSLTHNS